MKSLRIVLPSLLLLLFAFAPAAHAHARLSVNVSFFYDSLAPYGHWHSTSRFGFVWAPAHVAASWRPYADGHWVYCDYGWTWVSDYPWGWAPFHYGRWAFDPALGWVWIPGDEWAPAWVSFYEGDGWIGWAPLPPGASFRVGLTFARDPRAYVFVENRYFLDSHLGRRAVATRYNAGLRRRTANVTRYSTVGGVYVNRSLSVERIARATRRAVPTYRAVDVDAAHRAHGARSHDREIALFRPAVSSARPSHQPAASRHRVETRDSRSPVHRSTVRITRSPSRQGSRETARPSSRHSSRETARPSSRPSSRETARPSSRPSTRETARPPSRPSSRETARPSSRHERSKSTSRAQRRPAERRSSSRHQASAHHGSRHRGRPPA
jgi:Family of unknown function (DUF6600)